MIRSRSFIPRSVSACAGCSIIDRPGSPGCNVRPRANSKTTPGVSRCAVPAALARMGLRPRYITPVDLANGPPAVNTLILPHVIALSDREARSIARFIAKGGRVIADTPPGQFDGHGSRRPSPPIPGANPAAIQATLVAPADLARAVALTPAFPVDAPNRDVDSWLFRSRGQRLLALQRHTPEQTNETVTVDLHGHHARDLATGHDYGRPARLTLTIDPITPEFLAIDR